MKPRTLLQGLAGLAAWGSLRALPANDTLARVDAENLWKDQIQLDSCIASLDDDGLIEILENGALRLPHG